LRWWRCSTNLHKGGAEARTNKLEIEPPGLNFTCAVENGVRNMLYMLVECCGRDKWAAEGVHSIARGGNGGNILQKLEIELPGFDLARSIENGGRDVLYMLVGYRGRDGWGAGGVRWIAQGGRGAIPQKTQNEAAGARLSACRCKRRLDSIEEGSGVLWKRWMGY
jgi:hypothetical protein